MKKYIVKFRTSDGQEVEAQVVDARKLTHHASIEEMTGRTACKFCGDLLGREATAAGDKWHRHCASARPPHRKLNGAAVHAASTYKAFGRKG